MRKTPIPLLRDLPCGAVLLRCQACGDLVLLDETCRPGSVAAERCPPRALIDLRGLGPGLTVSWDESLTGGTVSRSVSQGGNDADQP